MIDIVLWFVSLGKKYTLMKTVNLVKKDGDDELEVAAVSKAPVP